MIQEIAPKKFVHSTALANFKSLALPALFFNHNETFDFEELSVTTSGEASTRSLHFRWINGSNVFQQVECHTLTVRVKHSIMWSRRALPFDEFSKVKENSDVQLYQKICKFTFGFTRGFLSGKHFGSLTFPLVVSV